ncbi:hypothetical protein HGM15179_008633 [Zosterops borbonicus]|uniref:Uncharacterized protein n=1 Tax=Zosterops borbonicus TaxID=364589 RepID=A0A8K1LLZ7_9PASS|nr:hypothetical protein HGM15179_008633 [Zosterops borbonicus]
MKMNFLWRTAEEYTRKSQLLAQLLEEWPLDCSPDCSIGMDMLVSNDITREDLECTKHDYKTLVEMAKAIMAQSSFSVILLDEREELKDDWKDPTGNNCAPNVMIFLIVITEALPTSLIGLAFTSGRTAMSGLRSSGLLGLVLLMLSAGYCKEKTDSTDLKDKQSLLNLIMEIIHELKRYHLEKDNGLQYFSKHDYNLDRREVEIVPRDLRMKDKFLKHLTGPLYFSPKCSKHFHRLYHNTRDCTIPAYVIVMTRNTKNQEKCLGNQQGNRTYYLLANFIVNKRFIFAD